MRQRPSVDIVVGVGSAPGDVQGLVQELGLAERIRWHPLLPQAQLADLYRQTTALVAPFVDEGLGLVAIEAQMSELPVVGFRSGGLTDVVVDGQTGLLVPPGDEPALAAALDRLLACPTAAPRGAGRAGATRSRPSHRRPWRGSTWRSTGRRWAPARPESVRHPCASSWSRTASRVRRATTSAPRSGA